MGLEAGDWTQLPIAGSPKCYVTFIKFFHLCRGIKKKKKRESPHWGEDGAALRGVWRTLSNCQSNATELLSFPFSSRHQFKYRVHVSSFRPTVFKPEACVPSCLLDISPCAQYRAQTLQGPQWNTGSTTHHPNKPISLLGGTIPARGYRSTLWLL